MRPEVFLGVSGTHDDWSERDRGLARALTVHEGTQNRYGIPIAQATDPETDGWWEVRWVEDFAETAVNAAREKESPKPGASPIVTLDPDFKPRSRSA